MILTQVISRVVFFCRRHRRLASGPIAACAILASMLPSPILAANTVVRMEVSYGTSTGNIDIELYDDLAPKTVENFLRYAGRGFYSTNGTAKGFFHRSARDINGTPLTIRAGGYWYAYDALGNPIYDHIPEDPPIANEFSLSRPNVLGTIAMGKKPNNPDSATSEWLINLADNGTNSLNLDYENGGYTVFGRVVTGMNVANAIGGLQIYSNVALPTPYGDINFNGIPLINYDPNQPAQPSNLVEVTRIPNVSSTITNPRTLEIFIVDVDMVLNEVSTVDTNTAKKLLETFKSPPDQSVLFNNGMFTLTMSGSMGTSGHTLTVYDGATTRPTRYYAYGKTPDDPSPHWYDFTFDGITGAETKSNRIVLHFVDGMRGDEDLTVNNSITHTGAQAVLTPIASTSTGGGCSITATPSRTSRSGDWALIVLFFAVLAIARKRNYRG